MIKTTLGIIVGFTLATLIGSDNIKEAVGSFADGFVHDDNEIVIRLDKSQIADAADTIAAELKKFNK